MNSRQIVFYKKDECHLCEEMERQLALFIARYSSQITVFVETRDIEDSESWYEEYREYVPVLVVDGEEVCHYFMDEDELKRALLE